MLDVNDSHTFLPLPPLNRYRLPPPYTFSLPPLLPPNITPYVSLTNPASYPTCGCSLQEKGSTALIVASEYGRTKTVQALLAAAGIDVNHANVSIYPLTPSHVVVGGAGYVRCQCHKHFFPTLISYIYPNPPSYMSPLPFL